jgi:hypothetical protein
VGGNFTMPVRWVTADGKRDALAACRPCGKPTTTPKQPGEVLRAGKLGQRRLAGEAILAHDYVNASKPRGLWQYLVGQRRVRKAPSVAYDTPDSVTSGIGLFDEAFNLFGPIDKHNLKLVGKRELYIPYNNNRAASAKVADLVTPNTLNPSLVRWELHRVWEVEATLAEGKRHVVPKRKYYIDEDSWQIILFDGWDAKGELWRTNYTLTLLAPDIPALVGNMFWGGYDLQTGAYYLNMASNELSTQYKPLATLPRSFFSPEELANGEHGDEAPPAGAAAGVVRRRGASPLRRRALATPALVTPKALGAATLAVARAGARLVAVGERGTVLWSDDGGAHWQQARVPVQAALTSVRFVDAHVGWAAGHLGVILKTEDGGQSWARLDGTQAAAALLAAAGGDGVRSAARSAWWRGPTSPSSTSTSPTRNAASRSAPTTWPFAPATAAAPGCRCKAGCRMRRACTCTACGLRVARSSSPASRACC